MAGHKTILPVGGGKSGAGKSVAVSNIGCALAMKGRKVVLVDAFPGGDGLHACFGIGRPPMGFEDLVAGRIGSLEEAAVQTGVEHLSLISLSGPSGMPFSSYSRGHGLAEHIRGIDADCVIIDLGGATSYNALDLFAISKTPVIVFTPEAPAIQNAYGFLKSFVYRVLFRLFAHDAHIRAVITEATDAHRADSVKSVGALCNRIAAEDPEAARRAAGEIASYLPRLLMNMSASNEDRKALDAFSEAARSFLGMETEPAGVLRASPLIEAACLDKRPFMLGPETLEERREITLVAEALLALRPEGACAPAPEQVRPGQAPLAGERKAFGFNDNVAHKGEVFHVQTEAHAGVDPVVETIVYNGGRIFFSKRVVCKEDEAGMTAREFAQRQHRAAMAAVKMDKIKAQG